MKCSKAQSPTNGHVHGADFDMTFTYGAVVTFSCLKGFHLERSLLYDSSHLPGLAGTRLSTWKARRRASVNKMESGVVANQSASVSKYCCRYHELKCIDGAASRATGYSTSTSAGTGLVTVSHRVNHQVNSVQ